MSRSPNHETVTFFPNSSIMFPTSQLFSIISENQQGLRQKKKKKDHMQRTRAELTFLFTLEHCWVDMAKAKFLQISQVTQITLRMYLPNYFGSFENYPWSCFQYLHSYTNNQKGCSVETALIRKIHSQLHKR